MSPNDGYRLDRTWYCNRFNKHCVNRTSGICWVCDACVRMMSLWSGLTRHMAELTDDGNTILDNQDLAVHAIRAWNVMGQLSQHGPVIIGIMVQMYCSWGIVTQLLSMRWVHNGRIMLSSLFITGERDLRFNHLYLTLCIRIMMSWYEDLCYVCVNHL